MEPRFDPADIAQLEERYWNHANAAQQERERHIVEQLAPAARQRQHFTLAHLLVLAQWKSPRTVPSVERNRDEFVREVTALALSEEVSEEMRIKCLPLLHGVQWPVASVILHFGFEDRYPILDFRALWSLQEPQPQTYELDLWTRYTDFCRQYIAEHGVSMRVFDRALWTYSKENQ